MEQISFQPNNTPDLKEKHIQKWLFFRDYSIQSTDSTIEDIKS